MQENVNHISEEALEQYAMRKLSESASETLEEHLLFCSVCQNRLDETERYIVAMRSAAKRIRKEGEGKSYF